MTKLSFVTIVYELEYPLAALQAHSMSRYLDATFIEEIILIDNSHRPMPAQWVAEILNAYDSLRDRVRILRAQEICTVPPTSGWYKQQVLKLAVAFLVQGEFYVVLDAKNHFAWPADREFFVTSDGRPCVNAYSYEAHPLRPSLERVMRFLGLDPIVHLALFTATVTPYTFRTEWVRELVLDVGGGSVSHFARVFVSNELTEFFLYAGWLVRGGHDLSRTFLFHQRFCTIIWPDQHEETGTSEQLAVAGETKAPLFAVHRNALKDMPSESRALLTRFWLDRALFQSEDQAEAFIEEFRRHLNRQSRIQLVRSLPQEAVRLTRGATRRLMRLVSRSGAGRKV